MPFLSFIPSYAKSNSTSRSFNVNWNASPCSIAFCSVVIHEVQAFSSFSYFRYFMSINLEDICFVSYVEQRLWWPIQSPNRGRKKKAKG